MKQCACARSCAGVYYFNSPHNIRLFFFLYTLNNRPSSPVSPALFTGMTGRCIHDTWIIANKHNKHKYITNDNNSGGFNHLKPDSLFLYCVYMTQRMKTLNIQPVSSITAVTRCRL